MLKMKVEALAKEGHRTLEGYIIVENLPVNIVHVDVHTELCLRIL
jgi:hypothetical protein